MILTSRATTMMSTSKNNNLDEEVSMSLNLFKKDESWDDRELIVYYRKLLLILRCHESTLYTFRKVTMFQVWEYLKPVEVLLSFAFVVKL